MSVGDRVILARNGGTPGKIASMVDDETAYVKLDSGSACAFRVDELIEEPTEAKAWPPRGIETK